MKNTYILLLLLLLFTLHAQTYTDPCTSFNTLSFPINTTNAISLGLIGIMLSLAIMALGYMIGTIFPNIGLRQWVTQNESWELIKSLIILASIYSIILFITSILVNIAQTTTSLQTQTSQASTQTNTVNFNNMVEAFANIVRTNYLQQGCELTEQSLYFLYIFTIASGFLRSFTIDADAGVAVLAEFVTIGVDWGFKSSFFNSEVFGSLTTSFIFSRNYSIIVDTYFIAFYTFLLFLLQYKFLDFIMFLGLILFIPIGIAFRSFPILRPLGGTLIGIGIGISLIYPSLLIFLNAPISNIAMQFYSISTVNLGNTNGFASDLLVQLVTLLVSSISAFQDIFLAFSSINSIFPFFNHFLITQSQAQGISIAPIGNGVYIIVQYILYIIDLVIGLSLTNDIAKLLGSSSGISPTITRKLGI